MNAVREFLQDGGAYFGIDGGASYATSWRTNMFNGTLYADAEGTGKHLL